MSKWTQGDSDIKENMTKIKKTPLGEINALHYEFQNNELWGKFEVHYKSGKVTHYNKSEVITI